MERSAGTILVTAEVEGSSRSVTANRRCNHQTGRHSVWLLFPPTFPRHNCAKHIVAAGISRVVYVAPYPKSLAAELYPDSIIVDSVSCAGQVGFEPFVGVAPNKYIELFMAGDRKAEVGLIVKWDKRTALPRFIRIPKFYLENEEENLVLVSDKLNEKGLLS